MHRKNIIHRDLKPDNILLIDKDVLQICISDLGLACRLDDAKEIGMKCGTPGYVAPEILRGIRLFTTKADIFSLGCFLFNMLTNTNLFQGQEARAILMANKAALDIQFTVLQKVRGFSAECIDLLMKMLNPMPEQRPSAEGCITHAWFARDKEALQSSLFINKNQ